MFVFIESHARAINNSRRCLEKRATTWTVEWNNAVRCLSETRIDFSFLQIVVPFSAVLMKAMRRDEEKGERWKPQQNGKHFEARIILEIKFFNSEVSIA